MPKYKLGCKAGVKYVYILESKSEKIIATTYSIPNGKMIVEALNLLGKQKKGK